MPVVLGDEDAALAASRLLEAEGFLVTPIRPPTVPAGTARLRIAFTAAHPDAAIARLAALVRERVAGARRMSALFLTATGTDIGKTFVAAGLIHALRRRGRERRGAEAGGQRLRGMERADERSGTPARGARPAGERRGDRAHLAVALPRRRSPPTMAARGEGQTRRFRRAGRVLAPGRSPPRPSVLLIEGIGGVMVPLDERHTVLDWMAELRLPAVLVAGSYLGTISHTLTALAALRQRRVAVRGASW